MSKLVFMVWCLMKAFPVRILVRIPFYSFLLLLTSSQLIYPNCISLPNLDGSINSLDF